jgi:hypothetical protein
MCSNKAADFEKSVQALLSPTALGSAVSLSSLYEDWSMASASDLT